jgi:hypothetical protein
MNVSIFTCNRVHYVIDMKFGLLSWTLHPRPVFINWRRFRFVWPNRLVGQSLSWGCISHSSSLSDRYIDCRLELEVDQTDFFIWPMFHFTFKIFSMLWLMYFMYIHAVFWIEDLKKTLAHVSVYICRRLFLSVLISSPKKTFRRVLIVSTPGRLKCGWPPSSLQFEYHRQWAALR